MRISFQNTNPERGRKLERDTILSVVRCLFQNTNPERGRKPTLLKLILDMVYTLFQNTNPERGRKPPLNIGSSRSVVCHFRTRTPKGDGNFFCCTGYDKFLTNFRTRTPKGDGNASHKPATFSTFSGEFQNTNPERGRKLPQACPSGNLCPFQNTNPERGRKPCDQRDVGESRKHFRTRTPKGDGNLPHRVNIGGRNKLHFRTRTPKGDGNIYPLSNATLTQAFRFQNTNPERGRKPCSSETIDQL